jgi:hypothetical protein
MPRTAVHNVGIVRRGIRYSKLLRVSSTILRRLCINKKAGREYFRYFFVFSSMRSGLSLPKADFTSFSSPRLAILLTLSLLTHTSQSSLFQALLVIQNMLSQGPSSHVITNNFKVPKYLPETGRSVEGSSNAPHLHSSPKSRT